MKRKSKKLLIFTSAFVVIAIVLGCLFYRNLQTQKSKEKNVPHKEYVLNGYYYAEDLGIRFKISPELQSQQLITRLSKNNSAAYGSTSSLDFSTKYLSDATKNCSLGALGTLFRGEGKYIELSSNTLIKQFKSFYIGYNNGGYNCGYRSSAKIQAKLSKAWDDLDEALKSIEELPASHN